MKLKAFLVALIAAILAVAGCAVDNAGQEADKATIRVGYQPFPSGDLIVKNNKWLEEALPDYNIKWTKFESGADVNTAFIAKELDFGALGYRPGGPGAVRTAEHPLSDRIRAGRRRRPRHWWRATTVASTRSPSSRASVWARRSRPRRTTACWPH